MIQYGCSCVVWVNHNSQKHNAHMTLRKSENRLISVVKDLKNLNINNIKKKNQIFTFFLFLIFFKLSKTSSITYRYVLYKSFFPCYTLKFCMYWYFSIRFSILSYALFETRKCKIFGMCEFNKCIFIYSFCKIIFGLRTII